MATLSGNFIAKHCQKTTNDLEKLIPDLSEEGKE